MKMKSESEVAQLCPTLHNPMDCSLPGSSGHGIFQARVLEWSAIAFPPCIIIYHYPSTGDNSETVESVVGEGNGTPLQYSCLENPIDGGAWWATVHGLAKSRTRLSDFTFTFTFSHYGI